MNHMNNDQIRQNVRNRYKKIAMQEVNSGGVVQSVPEVVVHLRRYRQN